MKSWNTKYAGKVAGYPAKTRGGIEYVIVRVFKKNTYAHRVIWEIVNGHIPDGFVIDHINGDSIDNRIGNLRLVTISGNNKNKINRIGNTSGCAGVHFDSKRNKWVARINGINKKRYHIGYYADKDQAIKARKQAELENGYHANHGRTK